MSYVELLIEAIKTLPEDYAAEVLDFVGYLKEKAAKQQPAGCPICAANRDPVTGNPRYKPEVYEGMQEVEDMLSGKIPSTLRRFKSVAEMFEDLERDEPDD